jgi:citrate synthase
MMDTSQTMADVEDEKMIVRGHDLCKSLMGRVTFADFLFLEVSGRLPQPFESRLCDAILLSLAEYGMSASAIAARTTIHAAPEAVQGAIAAGILGAGSHLLGATEETALFLQEYVERDLGNESNRSAAEEFYAGLRAAKKRVPGLGRPQMYADDPRAVVLFDIAKETPLRSTHRDALYAIQKQAGELLGRKLPINIDGAVAAVLSDLGFSWKACRGFSVVSRAVGMFGHVMDEIRNPTVPSILKMVGEAIPYRQPKPLL